MVVTLTLSDAVASLVPGMLSVTQQSLASCAEMKRAGFSVLARSTSWRAKFSFNWLEFWLGTEVPAYSDTLGTREMSL